MCWINRSPGEEESQCMGHLQGNVPLLLWQHRMAGRPWCAALSSPSTTWRSSYRQDAYRNWYRKKYCQQYNTNYKDSWIIFLDLTCWPSSPVFHQRSACHRHRQPGEHRGWGRQARTQGAGWCRWSPPPAGICAKPTKDIRGHEKYYVLFGIVMYVYVHSNIIKNSWVKLLFILFYFFTFGVSLQQIFSAGDSEVQCPEAHLSHNEISLSIEKSPYYTMFYL